MCSSRFQTFKTSFLENFHQAKTWAMTKANSEPALVLRSAIRGAVKSAFLVNYGFDLCISFVPVVSPWYNGLKITKYTVTAVTFVVTTGTAYLSKKYDASAPEIVERLQKQLQQVNLVKLHSDHLEDIHDETLAQMGNAVNLQDEVSPQLLLEEKEPEVLPKTACEECAESKSVQVLKATGNGALNGEGVHYILTTFFPETLWTPTDYLLSSVFFGGTFLLSYQQSNKDFVVETQMRQLDLDLLKAEEKINKLNLKLGSKNKLIQIANEGAVLTKQNVWFETAAPTECKIPVSTKKTMVARAATDGLVWVAAIHGFLDSVAPNFIILKCFAAVIALGAGTKVSYEHRLRKGFFDYKSRDVERRVKELRSAVDVEDTIVNQGKAYVAKAKQCLSQEQKSSHIQTDPDSMGYSANMGMEEADALFEGSADSLVEGSLSASAPTEGYAQSFLNLATSLNSFFGGSQCQDATLTEPLLLPSP